MVLARVLTWRWYISIDDTKDLFRKEWSSHDSRRITELLTTDKEACNELLNWNHHWWRLIRITNFYILESGCRCKTRDLTKLIVLMNCKSSLTSSQLQHRIYSIDGNSLWTNSVRSIRRLSRWFFWDSRVNDIFYKLHVHVSHKVWLTEADRLY